MELKEAIDKDNRKWNMILVINILAIATFISYKILEPSNITRLIMIISGSFILLTCIYIIFDHFLSDNIL